jgi:hypothetical protein
VNAPSRCVKGVARVALSPCQGGLLAWSLAQDKENRHLGSCTEATSLALTRGARSGGRHMSGRSDSRTRSLSGKGSSPRALTCRPVLGPINLPGLALYKLGPLGTPGLFPRQRRPSGSTILK